MLSRKLLSATAYLVSFLIGVGLTQLAVGRRIQPALHSASTVHAGRITSVAASPGGKYLASGYQDGHLKVWRVNGDPEAWERDFGSPILCVTFSRTGYKLAVLTRDGTVSCLGTMTGDVERVLHPLPSGTIDGGVLGYLSGSDPTLMAYGGEALKRWAQTNGTESGLHPFDTSATCITWAPDALRYASGNRSGEVKIYDKATYEELQSWQTKLAPVLALALSKDGSRLAVSGENGLQIRSPRNGEILGEYPSEKIGWGVVALAFSADATHLVTADVKGNICVWEYNEGFLSSKAALTLERQWGPFGVTVSSDACSRTVKRCGF